MCSTVFTEGDTGRLIKRWTAERAKTAKGRESPKRGAVATPVAPVGAPSDRLQPCLLLTSAPCKAAGGNVRYVYGVIEPHGVRYKQSQASQGKRVAAGCRGPADYNPSSGYRETICVVVWTWP